MHSCPECGGRMEIRRITHYERHGGRLFSFTRVPAWVCVQCHAAYLDALVLEAIENRIAADVEPTTFERIPVYDLQEVAHG